MKKVLVGIRFMTGLLVLVLAFAGSRGSSTDRLGGQAGVTGKACNVPVGLQARSASVSQSPCEKCGDTCQAKTDECKNGSVKACYLAAACLCQCNLDAGGCGSDKEALEKCVRDNEKNARDLGN